MWKGPSYSAKYVIVVLQPMLDFLVFLQCSALSLDMSLSFEIMNSSTLTLLIIGLRATAVIVQSFYIPFAFVCITMIIFRMVRPPTVSFFVYQATREMGSITSTLDKDLKLQGAPGCGGALELRKEMSSVLRAKVLQKFK